MTKVGWGVDLHGMSTASSSAHGTIVLWWVANALYILLTFLFIIYPNFYFGLSPHHIAILVGIVLGLTAVHVATRRPRAVVPLLFSYAYLAVLWLANVL